MPASKNPDERRGYGDRRAAAGYCGIRIWTFDDLIAKNIVPRGFTLTSNGKLFWKFSLLEEAMAKAARSRKPGRAPRGIVRQRLEAGKVGDE